MENDTDVCYIVRHTLPELNRIEIKLQYRTTVIHHKCDVHQLSLIIY